MAKWTITDDHGNERGTNDVKEAVAASRDGDQVMASGLVRRWEFDQEVKRQDR